jgi:hypothetical protein
VLATLHPLASVLPKCEPVVHRPAPIRAYLSTRLAAPAPARDLPRFFSTAEADRVQILRHDLVGPRDEVFDVVVLGVEVAPGERVGAS